MGHVGGGGPIVTRDGVVGHVGARDGNADGVVELVRDVVGLVARTFMRVKSRRTWPFAFMTVKTRNRRGNGRERG